MMTNLHSSKGTRPRECAQAVLLIAFSVFVLLLSASAARSQGASAGVPSQEARGAQRLVIPDGTPVHFRLAHGLLAGPVVRHAPVAKPGDQVRLVVAADVLVEGRIVIARGAAARATVVSAVAIPQGGIPWGFASAGASGSVELRLDWVEAITGDEVPMRSVLKGRPKPARLKAAFVPAGKRLKGFVDGSVELSRDGVEQAQAQLPLAAPKAFLTIYRTKGQKNLRPWIYCGETTIAQIGEREYLTLTLAPGRHRLRAETEEIVELVTDAGQDYFLRLQSRKLKPVDVTEGEDAIAELEPVADKDLAARAEACVPVK